MQSRIVIARPQGGRGNLAVPGGITGKPRRKRNCLPEIAPQGHFLALPFYPSYVRGGQYH